MKFYTQMNIVKRYFAIFILLVIIQQSHGQSQPPIIENNNLKYIDELVNPITLNWTVIDDNLVYHEIYQFDTLIDRDHHDIPSDSFSTNILLSFHLSNGRYEFTLKIWDADNQTAVSNILIQKGSNPPSIATLSSTNMFVFFGALTLVSSCSKVKLRTRYR